MTRAALTRCAPDLLPAGLLFEMPELSVYVAQRTGIFSCRRRLMPIVIVVIDEGHEPHAPFRRRYTIGPSISASSTLPPSARARRANFIVHPSFSS